MLHCSLGINLGCIVRDMGTKMFFSMPGSLYFHFMNVIYTATFQEMMLCTVNFIFNLKVRFKKV